MKYLFNNYILYKLIKNISKKIIIYAYILFLIDIFFKWGLGIGDWGLGIGDWGLGPIPNPQSPNPKPQSPTNQKKIKKFKKKCK